MIALGLKPRLKKADIFSYLAPLLKELLVLESKGIKIVFKGVRHTFKVYVLNCIGDIPGLAKSCLSSFHTSKLGCRTCSIEGICHQQDRHTRNTGMYHPPSLDKQKLFH